MAKKAAPSKPSKNDTQALLEWVEDEIESINDDAAAAILEMLKSDDSERYSKAMSRIDDCKKEVTALNRILDWCEGKEETASA